MKKVMMIAAIAAALASCQSKGTQDNVSKDETATTTANDNSTNLSVYEGIVPAADGPGIRYVLSVDNVNSEKEGTYTLVTTYLDSEGAGKENSFTSKGTKQIIRKEVNKVTKTALKLTSDNGDAPVYFLIVNDTTLRLVNEDLQEAESGLKYDITLIK